MGIEVVVSHRVVPREREQIVRLGEPASLLCQSGEPLDLCLFELPNGKVMSLKTGKRSQGMSYFGDGLDKGHCGLLIDSVRDEHNGVFICTVTPEVTIDSQKGNMSLIVAKAPKKPVLNVHQGSGSSYTFKEGEMLVANCRVDQGRPPANITWYIGDERITDGLHMPEIQEYNPGGLTTVQQNFTRRLQYTDNGKMLKCVAEHQLLALSGMNTSTYQLNIEYGPKPLPDFEHFGLVEGEEGRISVAVPANPKPSFSWFVNDDVYYENDDDPMRRYHVLRSTPSREKGPGFWESVLVIRTLLKEDTDQKYSVKVTNKMGEQVYRVIISTNPEPKVLDLGVGMIFAIVVGVLLVLILLSILVFARAKGRWCFSGGSGRNVTSESSDTESAAERASNVAKRLPFKLTFKKSPGKPAADPQEAPMTNPEGDQEPKSDDEGVVYAELDLKNSAAQGKQSRQVRPEEDKTEYAEILHSDKPNNP
ncbi:CD80-like C2-set immunoglobulin domain [Nesidiocoris tenuis]|uniref:CD80-like C2-set immunoglobulin domain n=1 Tax=Nesidiocoris tenuis TaxID=355587 RepID=A0ABN7AGD4_9HEMI|nr:CD80-like C2-set immunoglobulin domain [Nesidiocoris tenuis]